MGIFVTDTGKRSELQERLAAELREKMARRAEGGGKPLAPDSPDLAEDSAYMEDFEKKPSVNGRVVGVIVVSVVFIVVAGLVIVLSGK